jgi:hypothetical protein
MAVSDCNSTSLEPQRTTRVVVAVERRTPQQELVELEDSVVEATDRIAAHVRQPQMQPQIAAVEEADAEGHQVVFRLPKQAATAVPALSSSATSARSVQRAARSQAAAATRSTRSRRAAHLT